MRLALSVPLVLALAFAGTADAAGPDRDLRLDVVYSRYQGERQISSQAYSFFVTPGGEESSVRFGLQVPVMVRLDAGAPTVMFKDVGTHLSCKAEPPEAGAYRLAFSLEQGTVAEGGSAANPALRTFRSQASLRMAPGETRNYVTAADPQSGETLKIDVTLNARP
ncbi:MAG TPA: hypothetical protein VFM88_23205 [Vicinamibacteria bacterium]|nr:hypothetical protein [Vicinamibacteria bacterium]